MNLSETEKRSITFRMCMQRRKGKGKIHPLNKED